MEGKFCEEYAIKDFYTCLTFYDNGEFKYEAGGDIGNSHYGKGDFSINENYLVLNYNKTEIKNTSYHESEFWEDDKNFIELNFNILDFRGNKNGFSKIVILPNKIEIQTSSDGIGKLKLKKLDKNCEVEILMLGYKTHKFIINQKYNSNINVYLEENYDGNPIKNKIDSLKIVESKDKYFKAKNSANRITIWNKIE